MKGKAWLVFILVLIICGQFIVVSLFHNVDDNGIVYGSSVISLAKWNYVSASFEISITPNVFNGTASPIRVVFPNGTTHTINYPSPLSTISSYSFTIRLPTTGATIANGAVGGPVALSQANPLNVMITQNVENVTAYVSSIMSAERSISFGGLEVDLYPIIIYGDAQVAISGFGFTQ